MSLTVLDASAAIDWLLRSERAAKLDAHLLELDLVAPELIDAEVLSGLRKRERLGTSTARATQALWRWMQAPVERLPHVDLVMDSWALRHSLTACDALYVALAQRLDCPLVTTDLRLAGAPNLGVTVTVVT
jgi:predicted nucleic acid-binding protein